MLFRRLEIRDVINNACGAAIMYNCDYVHRDLQQPYFLDSSRGQTPVYAVIYCHTVREGGLVQPFLLT